MARLTRAEALTGSNRAVEYYSDFVRSFAKTPVGNQLSRVTNEKSINQALVNLILTNLGERLFQPYIGSNILSSLFENNYRENLTDLEFFIENTIRNNEKRVNLLEVNLEVGSSENEILISIVYNTINNSEPITFEYILKRVR
jgi:phage baseplate assembly protein W